MREIKFRAYHKPSETMIEVYDLALRIGVINQGNDYMPFSEIELMQYTGLRDKNGKEIYEGDVVKGLYRDETGVVGYEFSSFHVTDQDGDNLLFDKQMLTEIEIIGNIYDNPELLNA